MEVIIGCYLAVGVIVTFMLMAVFKRKRETFFSHPLWISIPVFLISSVIFPIHIITTIITECKIAKEARKK